MRPTWRRRKDPGVGPGAVDGGDYNEPKFRAWLRGEARCGAARQAFKGRCASSNFYGVTWDKHQGASWALV